MAVQPIKSVVGDGEPGVQIHAAGVTGLNIHRKPLRLEGNAYDINRIKDACSEKLRLIEHQGMDPSATYTVNVPAPQEDE